MRVFLAAFAVAAYFCAMAWPGLHSGFSHDDLMNLTFALRDGWGKVLRGNVLFFSTQHRPLGALYYLSLFEMFGMNSLPFRIVGTALLGFNLWLLFRLTRLLTGSVEAGLYAALLIAWHGNFAPLFFGSGNIYDVLGFAFYIGTLGFYAKARMQGPLSPRSLAILALLQICALNRRNSRRRCRYCCWHSNQAAIGGQSPGRASFSRSYSPGFIPPEKCWARTP